MACSDGTSEIRASWPTWKFSEFLLGKSSFFSWLPANYLWLPGNSYRIAKIPWINDDKWMIKDKWPFWSGFSLKFSWLQFPKGKNADMNHQNGIVKIAKPCLSIEIMIMKNHQPNGRRVWGTLRAIWCLERANPWESLVLIWKMYRKPQAIHTNPLYFMGRSMVSGFDVPLIPWSGISPDQRQKGGSHPWPGKRKAAKGRPRSLGLRWASYHLPSGKLTKSYWKWLFIVDFPIKNGNFP